jgi:hypothetical protein
VKAIRVPADPAIPVTTVEVGSGWQDLAAAVGGQCQYIEMFRCPLTEDHGLVCITDEEGAYHNGLLNTRARALYPYPLKGDVLVLADGGDDLVDLPDEQAALLAVAELVGDRQPEKDVPVTRELSVYVAGDSALGALNGLLFDTLSEAENYAVDEGLEHVFSLDVTVTVANLTEV